jgi:hypothetical protein
MVLVKDQAICAELAREGEGSERKFMKACSRIPGRSLIDCGSL